MHSYVSKTPVQYGTKTMLNFKHERESTNKMYISGISMHFK